MKIIFLFFTLLSAWDRFTKGKSKRKDVAEFERHLEDNLFVLRDDLLSGTYRHAHYHEFHIFDPKHRLIHKAEVRDRVVHHLVYAKLLPLFERTFIFDSYSCRDGKGTHAAVRRLEIFTRKVSKNYHEPCWVLKFDIRKFFDSVDHEMLFDTLRKKIPDVRMMNLVVNIVESYSVSQPIGGGVGFEQSKTRSTHWKFNITTFCECLYECIRSFYQRRIATKVLSSVHRRWSNPWENTGRACRTHSMDSVMALAAFMPNIASEEI